MNLRAVRIDAAPGGGKAAMRTMRRNKIALILLVLATVLVGPGAWAGEAKPPAKVSIRLKWVPQFQSAGFHAAEKKGWYKDEGLDVTINPGGPNVKAVNTVASGSDTFGVTGPDQIMIAREKGLHLVGLMAVYQKSPTGFMAHRDSGIQHPKDFLGKRVAITFGSNTEGEYRAMMSKLGLDLKKVTEVPVRFDKTQFLQRQVDVTSMYVTHEVFVARKNGADPVVITPDRYGIHWYADTVFVKKETIDAHADMVRRFIRASKRGWVWALENVPEAIDIVLQVNNKLDREALNFEAATTKELVLTEVVRKEGFGWMERTRWEQVMSDMVEQKLLKGPTAIDDVMTTRFVKE
jgi:ABC-type nitrate/sulfonate/bicarbonate transport system substrate-binding protein